MWDRKKNNEIGKTIMNIGIQGGIQTSLGTIESLNHEINKNTKREEIDYSFIFSNQEHFENFNFEIYEIKI